MNKIIILTFFAFCTICINAQSDLNLRDSLSEATNKLAYNPDSIDLRLKKVGWNIQLEQWQYAKDDLDKVLNKVPTNIAGLYYRAFVNEKLNRYNFARLDYENLIVLVPDNFEAHLGLALLNQKDRHFTEALDQINQLVESYPDSALAFAARAGIEKERKMYELAEYDYSKAHELDSKNIDYLINRADIRITLGRFSEAKNDLDTMTKMGVPRSRLDQLSKKIKL